METSARRHADYVDAVPVDALRHKIGCGKQVGGRLYLHRDAVVRLEVTHRQRVAEGVYLSGDPDWNVVKLEPDGRHLSLLSYVDFFESPFPELISSCRVNLETAASSQRSYEDHENRPILHRKELLLPPDHPERPRFATLTEQLERARLLRNAHQVGYRLQWEHRLEASGYRVVEHELQCVDIERARATDNPGGVLRHRTAINRSGLSAPMQALARCEFLDGSRAVFDYGCGRGDDLRLLEANDVPASGWDPHYCPNSRKTSAPIVNLGFVINVIENPQEREDVLRDAFELADELLVVSAMLVSQLEENRQTYADGVISRRGTFQRYYYQEELRQVLSRTLGMDPVPVGPGIFFVFKEYSGLHAFLERRLTRHRSTSRNLFRPIPRPSQAQRARAFYEAHRDTLDSIWDQYLTLGRRPLPTEVEDVEQTESLFGSLRKALNFLERYHGPERVLEAANARADDLRVTLAMELFNGRRAARKAASRWQVDIKTLFGSRDKALESAQALLFSLGEPETLYQQCQKANAAGIGHLHDDGRAYTFHSSVLDQLPPELRTYVACAAYLYGDPASADLIKVHIESAKLTMMHFDDFEEPPLPRMLERIKLDFRRQTIDVFRYGEAYVPPYLYLKSRYIPSDFPNYHEQTKFDATILALSSLNLEDRGPPNAVFQQRLRRSRKEISGFSLTPATDVPPLDEPCGSYHTYRSFVECGETKKKSGVPNIPKQAETYNALHRLATELIDPVMDYFGGITLTFGFCSPELAKLIPNRIDQKRDQHASHELNTQGNLICPRLGAAVDFFIPHEDMLEVAQWIVTYRNFDRLYYYGRNRPLHVSVGPDNNRKIIVLNKSASHYQIPNTITKTSFLRLP